ncbi:Na+/proline symporter / Sensor histidine kinase PrlS [Caldimonas brevitalea]|uniref:histidine kinase n=2 Tax=Caldimonas brevitalea TaxID=413882 RepID=A0A0G3BKZ9_9BURK|nr:Na+/proline symporter / Sensor histidine kinase PrlS [Caldimonas brevitalea]
MTFLIATVQLWLFRNNLEQTLYREQSTFTTSVAENLDQQLVTLKNALLLSALAVTEADVASSDAAQRYLDTNAGLNAIFERSVFLFSPEGRLIAERPFLPGRRGQDFSWREYNKDAVRTRGPVISRPFVTTKDDHNVVIMFATPVFSKDGKKIIAINTGSFGLSNPKLLGNIAKTAIGKTGFMYLVTADGKLVMHPNRSRLLTRAFAPGENELFEKSLLGFEGTGMSIDDKGRRSLSTFKRIRSTDWIIVSVYPEAEAFQSFNQLARNLAMVLVLATLAVCALVWILTRGLVDKIQAQNKVLEQLRVESQHQLRIKTEFFNEASHDFRQRLHGMQLFVTALIQNNARDFHIILPKVKSAIGDLQRYLGNFLEITKLETISVRPCVQQFSLQDVFQRLELQFEDAAENRRVDLKFRYTALEPATDEKLLYRILENLISNAIKFSRSKVRVAARRRAAGVELLVLDNGIGIPESAQHRIFAAFYQVHEQPAEAPGGTGYGLGLSIVKRLLDLIGADIKMSSQVDKGTTVRLYLPDAAGSSSGDTAGPAREGGAPAGSETAAPRGSSLSAGTRTPPRRS